MLTRSPVPINTKFCINADGAGYLTRVHKKLTFETLKKKKKQIRVLIHNSLMRCQKKIQIF